MNKYQEALDYLIKNIEMLNRHSDGSFCQPNSSKNTLQELVEKTISKKPIHEEKRSEINERYGHEFWFCPNCKGLVMRKEEFCVKCGQKLDWK